MTGHNSTTFARLNWAQKKNRSSCRLPRYLGRARSAGLAASVDEGQGAAAAGAGQFVLSGSVLPVWVPCVSRCGKVCCVQPLTAHLCISGWGAPVLCH